jgi:hypothetical protein
MNQTLSKKQISEAIYKQLQKSVSRDLEFFQIFKNVKGTRFTSTGFELAKSLWRVYPIKFKQEYRVLNKTLLLLDERMEWPYYLSKRQLVLFSEMDAFEFSLYSGDINLWANKF